MRKIFLHRSVFFLTFLSGCALTQLVLPSSSSEVISCGTPPLEIHEVVKPSKTIEEKKLMAIYEQYGPAKSRHDREFFERVETDDYVFFSGDRRMTREQNVQLMESWPKGIFYEYHVQSIRVTDNKAVVTGWMSARYLTGHVRSLSFIDVCVKSGDEWKILSTTSIE